MRISGNDFNFNSYTLNSPFQNISKLATLTSAQPIALQVIKAPATPMLQPHAAFFEDKTLQLALGGVYGIGGLLLRLALSKPRNRAAQAFLCTTIFAGAVGAYKTYKANQKDGEEAFANTGHAIFGVIGGYGCAAAGSLFTQGKLGCSGFLTAAAIGGAISANAGGDAARALYRWRKGKHIGKQNLDSNSHFRAASGT